jgi:hypothetical protein
MHNLRYIFQKRLSYTHTHKNKEEEEKEEER